MSSRKNPVLIKKHSSAPMTYGAYSWVGQLNWHLHINHLSSKDQSSTLLKILLGCKLSNLESFVKHLSLHLQNMCLYGISLNREKRKTLNQTLTIETQFVRCRKGIQIKEYYCIMIMLIIWNACERMWQSSHSASLLLFIISASAALTLENTSVLYDNWTLVSI